MISSRELENKRKSYKSILGIVKAMKALSAANVRKGGAVLEHTRRYRDFIQHTASLAASLPGVTISDKSGRKVIVAFGSQYGLCGAFNERVLDGANEAVSEMADVVGVIYMGRRLADLAGDATNVPAEKLDSAGSIDGLEDAITRLLEMLYDKYKGGCFDEVHFVFPSFGADMLDVNRMQVLPPCFPPAGEVVEPPLLYVRPQEVMEGLIEEHLYISLYATALEAVIAENESRMRSMDYASKNIKKKIEDLSNSYNYALQEEVTGELLEIVSGCEALRKKEISR